MEFREELWRAVSQLEIRSRRHICALLAGNYQSAFRGSGMQFKEFRRYEPGDDIRHMSWAVTARTGHPTVKLYEEERELNVVLAVDVSGSSQFGMQSRRKIDMYAELTALLGLSALKSQDNVGLMLFHEEPVHYLPPRRTRDYVRIGLAHLLAQPMDKKKSDLRPTLRYLHHVLKTRSIIILVSDFFMPPFQDELRMLAEKHEVILLHCYDDAERGMGKGEGVHHVWDPESEEFLLVDLHSPKLQKRLNQDFFERQTKLETLASQCRSDYLALSMEDDYLQRLVHFFRSRGPSRL